MIDPRDPQHARDVLDFWFGAPDSDLQGRPRREWFAKLPAFDDDVRRRFGALHRAFTADPLLELDRAWIADADRILAHILVLDQFSRHLERDTPRAFALDARALSSADGFVAGDHHLQVPPVMRQFGYLPFQHCENRGIQQRSIALYEQLARDGFDEPLPWAIRHRDVIERFGRFPHRNAILGRASTPDEIAFLAQPGSRF